MRPIHLSRGTKVASAVLLTIFLFAIAMQAQSQESSSPEVQEMKAKLQQLEQEMQALKTQISAVQSRTATGAAATKPPAAPSGSPTTYEKPPEATEAEERGGKNSIDLYGFVMVDTGYESGQSDPNWFDVMRPTKLPS